MLPQALSDLRVLDLTHYVAGPYATKLLADYGAAVLKVEPPGTGEGARRLGPFPKDMPDQERSGMFLFLNTNKVGITLNLKTEDGRRLLLRLLPDYDVLVENFRPGVMERLGLDYATLSQSNPRLVMTRISNFGQTGPYRDYKAVDMVNQGMGGSLFISGEATREPVRFVGHQAQFHAGLVGAVSTMGAMWHAWRTGEGQQVDISMMEVGINIHELDVEIYAYSGELRKRVSSQYGNYPWEVYRCRDGFIALCVNNRQWRRVGNWIGQPELSKDPSLATPAQRYARYDELQAIFVPYCLERSMAELVTSAQAAHVPAMPVYCTKDMVEDPQYKSRDYFLGAEHAKAGGVTYPGAPFKLSETPWQLRRPAPMLGEHNEEVLCGRLGMSRADLVRLRQAGVI